MEQAMGGQHLLRIVDRPSLVLGQLGEPGMMDGELEAVDESKPPETTLTPGVASRGEWLKFTQSLADPRKATD